MKCNGDNRKGFSLTEILLAVGVLAIGMVFVAGVFPAGMVLSTRSAEQTIAAVVADEAFAKIRLISNNPTTPIGASAFSWGLSTSFEDVAELQLGFQLDDEFAYPSTGVSSDKQYYWSAIGRQIDNSSDVQVTVFVCRKVGSGLKYWRYQYPATEGTMDGLIPRAYPVVVTVSGSQPATWPNPVTVTIVDTYNPDLKNPISDGYTVVNGLTGEIMRVMERNGQQVTLYAYDAIDSIDGRTWLWVVPSPAGGGRYPCIGVYQKVIRF